MTKKRVEITANKNLVLVVTFGLLLLIYWVVYQNDYFQSETINKSNIIGTNTPTNSPPPVTSPQTTVNATTTPTNYSPGPIVLTFKQEITKDLAEKYLNDFKLNYKLIYTTPPLIYEIKVAKIQEQFWIDKFHSNSQIRSAYINYQNTLE